MSHLIKCEAFLILKLCNFYCISRCYFLCETFCLCLGSFNTSIKVSQHRPLWWQSFRSQMFMIKSSEHGASWFLWCNSWTPQTRNSSKIQLTIYDVGRKRQPLLWSDLCIPSDVHPPNEWLIVFISFKNQPSKTRSSDLWPKVSQTHCGYLPAVNAARPRSILTWITGITNWPSGRDLEMLISQSLTQKKSVIDDNKRVFDSSEQRVSSEQSKWQPHK